MASYSTSDASKTPVQLVLFDDVSNAAQVRAQLIAERWACACVDATMVADELVVLAAAQRAVIAQTTGTAKAHMIHTELLYQLSPRNNIAEALKTFGIGDSSRIVLGVSIGSDATLEPLLKAIKGNPVPLTRLREVVNSAAIRTLFKLEASHTLPASVPLLLSACAVKNV